MNTMIKNRPTFRPTSPALTRITLLTDGNAHALAPVDVSALPDNCASEALLPQIRTTAMMLAAARRHTRHTRHTSPAQFSDEADWLAARLLVLQVRVLHLPAHCQNLLDTANRRAEAFAREHGLPFRPARLHISDSNPTHLLTLDCQPDASTRAKLFENMQTLRKIVFTSRQNFPKCLKLK